MDVEKVHQYFLENHSVKGFSGAKYQANGSKLLEHKCDILIPAALQNQIHAENAHKIQAKVILEAANGPVTYQANIVLRKAKKYVIPDIYANAGGVVVSYFEWMKNLSHTISFGILERNFLKHSSNATIDLIQRFQKKKIPKKLLDSMQLEATELNLIHSGLLESMKEGFENLLRIQKDNKKIPDLTIAAYILAVEKINEFYEKFMI